MLDFIGAAFDMAEDLDCAGDFAGADCFAFAFAMNAAVANNVIARTRAGVVPAKFMPDVLL